MSLFNNIIPSSKDYAVLSASRMTDMPAFYPRELIDEVNTRIQKGIKIHTLVLWTKHPRALLKEPLKAYLEKLKKRGIQLYVHLTITGLGKEKLGLMKNGEPFIPEPNVPYYRNAISEINKIVLLTESNKRLRVRIDPLIRIVDAKGEKLNNFQVFEDIIKLCAEKGVVKFNFSLLERGVYKKVDKRFNEAGILIQSLRGEERERFHHYILDIENRYGVQLYACAVNGFQESRCIDGEEFALLHDKKLPCNLVQPRTREKCACTKSIDIGGWPVKKCFSGCWYCYARPVI